MVFGLFSHSLTLLADAGHNLGDVLGLLMAWAASNLQRRDATERYTYGFRRTSVLAALFNALLLLVSVGAIAWEAIRRIIHPEPVAGLTIIWVAAVGVRRQWRDRLDVRPRAQRRSQYPRRLSPHGRGRRGLAGRRHRGLILLRTGWTLVDPISSLLIVAIILFGTWGFFRDSLNLALDAVPRGIDLAAGQAWLESSRSFGAPSSPRLGLEHDRSRLHRAHREA